MAVILLFLFPLVVMAHIEIEVAGRFGSEPNMAVYFSGSEVGIISDEEKNTFHLDDSQLADAVKTYFGSRPNNAFLRSPTPWGDLYKTFEWNQVLRTLIPKSGRILEITSEPQIVMKQIIDNNSSKPASFNVGISQELQNTVISKWMKGGELSVEQEIQYGVDIEVMKFGGKTKMSFTNSWGESSGQSQSVTIGTSSAMELLLTPGQSVLAQLKATRGVIKVEIEFEASLSGSVAVNYDETYRGHHFWALDVQGVMAAAKLNNKLISKQIIDISFYSNATVIVQDRVLGYKMMEVSI